MKNGVWAALLTPMHKDLSCDAAELAFHAKDLLDKGCQGVVLFGTTGEGASFSTSEKLSALRDMLKAGIDPEKIIIANGSSNIPDTVELLQGSISLGCSYALVSPPCFYKNISDEGVISFYRQVIDRTASDKLRLLLYHIPQLTGIPITSAIIKALKSEIVIGIKESEGNLALTREIIKNFPGFKVFVGKEIHLLEAMKHGASGAICGLANLYPNELLSLYNQKEVDLPHIEIKRHFIAAFKKIMQERRGTAWISLRPPLTYD